MSYKRIRGPEIVNNTTVQTAAGGFTIVNEAILIVNKTSGAATAVTLPTPVQGQKVTVKDGKGDAATNNITVTPASGNIDGQANHVININFGCAEYVYNGTQWNLESYNTSTAQGLLLQSFSPTLTAFATGGQTSAVLMPSMINRVGTVATQGDSVKLPPSQVGLEITVINRGAQPMQVFGSGTDTVNGIATATGISQGINTEAIYTCVVAGNWEVPITSLLSTTPTTIGASGAIPAHVSHVYVINKAGVAVMTLAAPTAGVDDGLEIVITSSTANAHTVTATGLFMPGTAAVNLATFAAQPGAGLTLMAFNAKWIVLCSVAITFS